MVRGLREGATSALGLSIVVAALVSIDPRVRERFWSLFDNPSGGSLSPLGDRLGDLGGVLLAAARDQSIENAPLLIFSVVGVMLVVFMLRT
jgi:hypothetical protein